MASIQNLEFELQKLLQEKKYSEIIFEITSKTKEEERNAGLSVLLGISRMSLNKKDKNQVGLAVKDFKNAYFKEKESVNGLNALTNFVISSSILSDFEDIHVDFDEIKNFYKTSPEPFKNQRAINIAMTMVYSRMSDYVGMIFHLEKIVKSNDYMITDLCNYGYWRCFDKNWSQSDFYKFGKFLNDNLKEYPQEKIIKFSGKKNEKIKIGFLSADIKEAHSVTYFLKTVLRHYDKNKFEIILFTNQIKEDKTSKEVISLVDKTINVGRYNDLKALNTIREHNLDIMIDIMGYTSRNRIELYKTRLARKQIIWMGYCNTSGLKNMDYIITDPNLILKDEKKYYTEEILYLPEIWNCHSGLDFKRSENPAPFLKNNYLTFGSFNNPAKINENVVNCWSDILKKVEGSKMIIKCANRRRKLDRIEEIFKLNGVLDSVTFHTRIDKVEDHLNLYKKIDIALDTFPYNGVTTSFEAIWMGVPVITMSGYNFNSRCGVSINRNLKMENLIASDEKDYVSKVIDLSKNTKKFLDLRKSIFVDALKSPLFDQERFSKSFFKVLEEITN